MSQHDTASLYPAFLDLHNCAVLVVGGGEVAARKTARLLQSGARVTVVAPQFVPAFAEFGTSRCRKVRRPFKSGDLKRAKLVFAATDDLKLNARIAKAAAQRGCFVNVAAPPQAGDMHVPATFTRGKLTVAVSTQGASAALARALRIKLERAIGPEWAQFVELLEERRARVLASIPDAARREAVLRKLGSPRWAAAIKREGEQAVAAAMDKIIGNELARTAGSTGSKGKRAGVGS